MAFIKYSIGSVSSATDIDSTNTFETKELDNNVAQIAFCNKCGLQFALASKDDKITCECGGAVRLSHN